MSCGGHHLHCNKLAAARMFLGSLLWSLGLRQDCPGRCGNLDTTHAVRPEARPSNSGFASRFSPLEGATLRFHLRFSHKYMINTFSHARTHTHMFMYIYDILYIYTLYYIFIFAVYTYLCVYAVYIYICYIHVDMYIYVYNICQCINPVLCS